MSYARWSNSSWYAFYNVNGCLSLWYDMAHIIDITYEEALTLTKEKIIMMYECTEEEANEAMVYVGYYIEEYDPKDKEEFQKEIDELLKKLGEDEGQR